MPSHCTGPGGVWIIDPAGKHLGTIALGEANGPHVGWGGGDWKTLFMTTFHELACVRTKIAGVPVPGGFMRVGLPAGVSCLPSERIGRCSFFCVRLTPQCRTCRFPLCKGGEGGFPL